jgi:hypothetical protein
LKLAATKETEDSVDELERLIKLAEKAADWDEAARLSRRVVFLAGRRMPRSPSGMQTSSSAGRREDAENVWHL